MLKSTISDDELAITSVDDLPLEYIINVQNIVTLIMSILNGNHNHYFYETFLEKYSKNICKLLIMTELMFLKVLMLIR